MKIKLHSLPGPFDFLAVLFLLGLTQVGFSNFGDPGVFWHLKTGRLILSNGTIPSVDPFLTPSPANLWVCDQWLSDIILYATYHFGGWNGLSVITLLFLISAYIQTAGLIAKYYTKSLIIVFVVVVLAVLTSICQWFTRPVVISFLFVSITYLYALQWANTIFSTKRYIIFTISCGLFFLLWANLHPAFPIGLFILSVFSAQKIINAPDKLHTFKITGQLIIICVLSTLINPFGTELYKQVFGLVSSDYFMKLNNEWKSPDFQNPMYWFFMGSLSIIIISGSLQKIKKLQLGELACFLTMLILAFLHNRYIPFFAITMIPLLVKSLVGIAEVFEDIRFCAPLNRIFKIPYWEGSCALYLITTSIILLFLANNNEGKYEIPQRILKQFPIKALNSITSDYGKRNIKVFHTPNWGGIITFFYWPPLSPFIDDRNSLIGKDRYEDFLAISQMRPNWRELIAKYGFEILLLDPKSSLARHLEETKDWAMVYQDSIVKSFKRK